ncbi:class I SAM-dependent DNA methyltransferase [Methylocystis heyeri]|uniref:site-specific DNA-methyltransferase (adenine-specific) n=1 Tax=Methylocystis heyeri TaxID=391905 RepID=A0A6B8KF29_9HYPH|nr:class I SAM-dependent DNA methyltransferase [Methylocystis heyeri]QGM45063.1 class I SAM-dependent DNA methyltransferase [Methylocystis heyeri]
MTPQDFIRKWKTHALTERASAQEHFIDLCRLVGHPTPAEDDPQGDHFTFEKGASIVGGGDGWADVWKKGYFAWEYKKRRRNLDEAMTQLTRYAAALEHPPLLVVCDTIRFQILTTWTNLETKKYSFELEDLTDPEKLKILHAVFHDPEALKPTRTRAMITADAAKKFQTISDALQSRNPDREAVAHFVNQLVFCFFADSVKLLPEGLLKKLLQTAEKRPHKSREYLQKLFDQMKDGGEFDLTEIAWFNGGLFDGRAPLALEHVEIGLLFALTSLDWSLIDPTIFGTLFERFLDPDKRAQIGAHYTDPDKIMMIVEPVVLRPLRARWRDAFGRIGEIMRPAGEAGAAGRKGQKDQDRKIAAARARAEGLRDEFIDGLTRLRILDPACGSGNFLYLALQGVKDIEYCAINDCETLGLGRPVTRVGPEILLGIEINPFAAELARTTIWIGDIQWSIKNAIYSRPTPILRKLDSIEQRDAVLNADGSEAQWPETDFIIGNPPFLGGKKLRAGLGHDYVERLFAAYDGRVPAEADLVCYWFSKAWEAVGAARAKAVGLVATNSIRGGANRRVLEPIAQANAIFEAWSDEPWTIDGAAVRVSLVCFGATEEERRLDGQPSAAINADLSGRSSDVTLAQRLKENEGVAFMGDTKGGAFDIPGELAREWLRAPLNPNGRPNSEVLRPWVNGLDVTRRPRDMWIIDFGWEMSEDEAAMYEAPFAYVLEHVKPERDKNRRDAYRKYWWRHVEARPAMWAAIKALAATSPAPDQKASLRPRATSEPGSNPGVEGGPSSASPPRKDATSGARYIATPRVARYRSFLWMHGSCVPDSRCFALARNDEAFFGILQSGFHEHWSMATGSWHGVGDDPVYNTSTCFETFPFPAGLTPNIPATDYADDPRAKRIAAAAKKLDELRRNWLNPPDLVEIVPEVVPGYPDRILPRDEKAADLLKKRTLTNLYNERPQWLQNAHAELDRAVAAAYGWPEDISTEDALAKLLELNLERSARQ